MFERNMKFRKYSITQVAEPDLPVVSGCTESLALVKSAMSFRGPPSARCCRWYFFSSDKGIKRFIILWYWTSTWERHTSKKNSSACSNVRHQPHLLVYHAPFGVVWFTAGVKVDVFLIKLCVVHIRFLHDLIIKQSVAERWLISVNHSISGTEAGLAFVSPAIPGSLQLLW